MYFKIIPLEFIENGANILLENIGLFFVSLIVGAFVYLPVIKKELFTVFAIFILSSVFLIILTGLTTQYFLTKRVCKDKMEQDND
jgi:holin-like protein